jgi:hypothetical protein
MGEVIELNIPTLVDIPVETILDGAREADLQTLFLVGELPDGQLYIAGSSSDAALNGWMLDQAKRMLLRMSDPNED